MKKNLNKLKRLSEVWMIQEIIVATSKNRRINQEIRVTTAIKYGDNSGTQGNNFNKKEENSGNLDELDENYCWKSGTTSCHFWGFFQHKN